MGEIARDDCRHASFWSEHVVAAMSKGHALYERDTVNWTDLRGQRFMLPTADPGPDIRDMLIGMSPVSTYGTDLRL